MNILRKIKTTLLTLTFALVAQANDVGSAVADSGDLGLTREQMKAKYSRNWPYIRYHYHDTVTDKKGVKHELPAPFWKTVYSNATVVIY
jgi:hypothetical protein